MFVISDPKRSLSKCYYKLHEDSAYKTVAKQIM